MPFRICAREIQGLPAVDDRRFEVRDRKPAADAVPEVLVGHRLPRLRAGTSATAGGGIATSGFRSSSSRRTGSEPGDPVPPALPPEQEGVNGNAVGNTQKVSGRAGRKGRTRPGNGENREKSRSLPHRMESAGCGRSPDHWLTGVGSGVGAVVGVVIGVGATVDCGAGKVTGAI